MSLEQVSPGQKLPSEMNVVIEIPMRSDPIKYEVDKESGLVHVDRFMATSMYYPCNYGYVPQTLSEDGDPADVLVITPYALHPGVVIACRPVGVMRMTDESGVDAKILAVPVDKLTTQYRHIKEYTDLGTEFIAAIEHFFQHYKDLEKGKWVKISGWEGQDAAKAEIMASVERYRDKVFAS